MCRKSHAWISCIHRGGGFWWSVGLEVPFALCFADEGGERSGDVFLCVVFAERNTISNLCVGVFIEAIMRQFNALPQIL
jgi:hypothetical protein